MKHQNPQNSFHSILRKHLNADALFRALHKAFSKVPDFRQGDIKISMKDALMSGFAMFSLKDPSLLAFDERRGVDENLESIYHIEDFPCDTQMRTILDEVNPESLSRAFKGPFRQLQRGKALEPRIGDVGSETTWQTARECVEVIYEKGGLGSETTYRSRLGFDISSKCAAWHYERYCMLVQKLLQNQR